MRSYAVFFPVLPVIAVVKENRLQIVHRMGKFSLGCLVFFKLIKERDQLCFLVIGKQRVDPLFCCVFPDFLRFQAFRIVGIGISGIYLNDVMDQAHQHYFCNIHFFIGILAKQICHDSHMPCMLCVIFVPAMTGEMCLPENILFFVYFKGKCQLPFQSFIHRMLLLIKSDLSG